MLLDEKEGENIRFSPLSQLLYPNDLMNKLPACHTYSSCQKHQVAMIEQV